MSMAPPISIGRPISEYHRIEAGALGLPNRSWTASEGEWQSQAAKGEHGVAGVIDEDGLLERRG